MSEYFREARLENVTLNHPNFSNVQGDQYNHNNMTLVTTTHERDCGYGEYNEMRRGDIRLIRDIWSYIPWHLKRNKWIDMKCEKKMFTGEVVAGTGQGMRLTVVGYEGRDAQKKWTKDFQQYSRTLRANHAHLLAINRSRIPLLIFPGELVPAAHFMANAGALGKAYFGTLSYQLDCRRNRMWMDVQRGILCQGPEGPGFRPMWFSIRTKNVPSTVELLQEDVFLRFLIGCQSEWADRVVVVAPSSAPHPREDVDFESNHPTVFSTLTNTPIAAITGAWWNPYAEGVLLENGLTRFMLQDPAYEFYSLNKIFLRTVSSGLRPAWLSQAWSVFHTLGVSLEDDLSQYKLFVPWLTLKGSLSQSESERQRRPQQPIYLFIRPLPSTPLRSCTTPSLHYWSLEEDGRSPLSIDKCHHLGLPVALKLRVFKPYVQSWSNETYRKIHQYQIARGFDPTTTDFAQSIGYQYPAYKPPQDDSDRFEEVDVIEAEIDVVDTIQDTHHSSTYSEPTAPANKRSFSSRIKQWGHQLKL